MRTPTPARLIATRSRASLARPVRYALPKWPRRAFSSACSEADVGILDFLKRKPEPTASVAKERLRIIVAQERSTRGAPDYLPLMRNELLEVIKKYVNVALAAITINVERD